MEQKISHTYSRFASGCSIYYGWFEAMHTRIDILLGNLKEDDANRLMSLLRDEILQIDGEFNRFAPLSTLSRINNAVPSGGYVVNKKICDIFASADEYRRRTAGAFDIAVGSRDYLSMRSYYKIDKQDCRLRFPYSGATFDFGGYAKGYALEQVVKILREYNVKDALVNIGNSTIWAAGVHPAGEKWKVGISNPLNPTESVASIELDNCAMSTSGNKPQESGHIVSTDTNAIDNSRRIITVVSESPLDCEVLSTALFVATETQKQAIVDRFDLKRIIEVDYSSGSSVVKELL